MEFGSIKSTVGLIYDEFMQNAGESLPKTNSVLSLLVFCLHIFFKPLYMFFFCRYTDGELAAHVVSYPPNHHHHSIHLLCDITGASNHGESQSLWPQRSSCSLQFQRGGPVTLHVLWGESTYYFFFFFFLTSVGADGYFKSEILSWKVLHSIPYREWTSCIVSNCYDTCPLVKYTFFFFFFFLLPFMDWLFEVKPDQQVSFPY